MASVNQVTDYIIVKLDEGGGALSTLKLQKLLYYVQAWSLATKEKRAFDGQFEAWVHGPVCRDVFYRFRDTHSLYGIVHADDEIRKSAGNLDEASRIHIDEVLEAYAPFSGTQLEVMTHREDPWIRARGKHGPSDRCETVIKDEDMRDFYKKMMRDIESEDGAARA